MKYHFYILISLIVFFSSVKSITMTKKEVLKLDLKQYNEPGKCPEFGYNNNSFLPYECSFTFYCMDNICQPVTNSSSPYFEFIERNHNIKKYIRETCLNNDMNCTTEKCTVDSDCISNKCSNSTCIQGESLFTECSDVNDDSDFDHQVQIMKCGKPDKEECSSDDQCAGRCYYDYCHSH
eukprot:jgi/Orpsp1_1/1187943/evm.model.d7180000061331.1